MRKLRHVCRTAAITLLCLAIATLFGWSVYDGLDGSVRVSRGLLHFDDNPIGYLWRMGLQTFLTLLFLAASGHFGIKIGEAPTTP